MNEGGYIVSLSLLFKARNAKICSYIMYGALP